MVDNLTDIMQREWNLTDKEKSDRISTKSNRFHTLSRKVSDNNNNNNNSNNQHHQPTNNDYYDANSLGIVRNPRVITHHQSLETSYDTDGVVSSSANRMKRHRHNRSDNYDYLLSPRISNRRNINGQTSKIIATVPLRGRLSQNQQSTVRTSKNDIDKDEESNYENDFHHRALRLSTRARQPSNSNTNHGSKAVRPTPSIAHNNSLPATVSAQPLRIIFMRHSERANQALGSDWFLKAFRTKTYQPYDRNLPFVLPKRKYDQAYEFDPPLTVSGLQSARFTGRAMMQNNLTVDLCLTSNALRCVQTCERILTGMDRRERIPLRIEPGLFECPHYNQRIVDSFMSKKELMDNKYHIKHDYKPLISKVTVPETLDDYFDRSAFVMRAILDRYGRYGGTILIVTHAPGLLALTDALKGLRPQTETFYRNVSLFPPLATYVAEYDTGKWKFSDQPFNILSTST